MTHIGIVEILRIDNVLLVRRWSHCCRKLNVRTVCMFMMSRIGIRCARDHQRSVFQMWSHSIDILREYFTEWMDVEGKWIDSTSTTRLNPKLFLCSAIL